MDVYTCKRCKRKNITKQEVTECFYSKCKGPVVKEIHGDDSSSSCPHCGGSVPAESKRLDGGSTDRFSLPRSTALPDGQGSVDTCPLCKKGIKKASAKAYVSYTCGTKYHAVTKELLVQG